MAYTSSAVAPRTSFAFTGLPAFSSHISVWRMVRDALVESRQAQLEHEIERYLAGTGGKFTDEAEREIERICAGPQSWRW